MSTALDNVTQPRAGVESNDGVVIFHASDTDRITVALNPTTSRRGRTTWDTWERYTDIVRHRHHKSLAESFAYAVDFLETF
jgi:hypothetical protein